MTEFCGLFNTTQWNEKVATRKLFGGLFFSAFIELKAVRKVGGGLCTEHSRGVSSARSQTDDDDDPSKPRPLGLKI